MLHQRGFPSGKPLFLWAEELFVSCPVKLTFAPQNSIL